MKVEAINIAGSSSQRMPKATEKVDEARKAKDEVVQEQRPESKQLAPEELLQQIKSLTEDGVYSVRFENDERTVGGLVVKIVDRENDEVIRQVPVEEILELKADLDDLRGNLVNTQS